MRIGGTTASLVAAALLLASCETLTMPGDTKAKSAKYNIVKVMRQIEKQLYQCASTPTVRNTRFDHTFNMENFEE